MSEHQYPNGCKRSEEKPFYGLIYFPFLKRLAQALTKGSHRFDTSPNGPTRNYQVNDRPSAAAAYDHLIEHLLMWRSGDTSEDHLGHASANLMFLTWYENNKVFVPSEEAKAIADNPLHTTPDRAAATPYHGLWTTNTMSPVADAFRCSLWYHQEGGSQAAQQCTREKAHPGVCNVLKADVAVERCQLVHGFDKIQCVLTRLHAGRCSLDGAAEKPVGHRCPKRWGTEERQCILDVHGDSPCKLAVSSGYTSEPTTASPYPSIERCRERSSLSLNVNSQCALVQGHKGDHSYYRWPTWDRTESPAPVDKLDV